MQSKVFYAKEEIMKEFPGEEAAYYAKHGLGPDGEAVEGEAKKEAPKEGEEAKPNEEPKKEGDKAETKKEEPPKKQ